MILLELAAQGVRGVAPAGGRATLRPGYNVVAADGAALRRLLEALLYPDARDADAIPRAPGGPAGAALRAGLTLVGNDRATYRLVRDFAQGCQLHRFDPGKRAFALVAQELADVRTALSTQVGVPPRARLSALLALSAAELPSRQGAGPAPSAAPPPRQALAPDQARRRIAQLEGELEKARVADGLQRELDGLQARLSGAEEALRAGQKLRDGLEKALAARAELDQAAEAAARLGQGAETRIATFEKASARADDARAKVEAERAALAETEARGAPPAFWKEPLFWPGPAAGVALAVAGSAGAAVGSEVRHLALLAVPAFGWGAWRALQWVGALEAWDRVARRRRIVDDWERKALGGVDRELAAVRDAMKVAGASSVAELREALSRVADADAVVAEWRRRLTDWEASPEAQTASAKRAEVEAAQRALEERLSREVGGFVRDPGSIEAEIRRLQAEARAPARAQPAAAAAPAPAPADGSPWKPGEDPLRAILERAAEETGVSPASTARAVAARASQALAGLSFQRLQSIQADERGGLAVQAAGRPVPAASLPLADRDLVFLSVKLGLLEQALAAGGAVAVVEDAFGGVSDGARRFAARLLKQLAKPGQLVHATADAAFREAADHAA